MGGMGGMTSEESIRPYSTMPRSGKPDFGGGMDF